MNVQMTHSSIGKVNEMRFTLKMLYIQHIMHLTIVCGYCTYCITIMVKITWAQILEKYLCMLSLIGEHLL